MAEIKEEENKVLLVIDDKAYDMGQAQTTGIPKEWGYKFAQDMIDRGFRNKGEYVLSLMIEGYQAIHKKEDIVSNVEKKLSESQESLVKANDFLERQSATLNLIEKSLLTLMDEDDGKLIKEKAEEIREMVSMAKGAALQAREDAKTDSLRLEKKLDLNNQLLIALCSRDRHIDVKGILERGGNV